MAIFLLTACGGSSSKNEEEKTNVVEKTNEEEKITVTGADGTVYHSYQTACSKGDFDAARDYIGKMKDRLVELKAKGWSSGKTIAYKEATQQAEEYVANEEIQYLASLNEEQANNRIILILNQRSVEGLEAAEMACLGKHILKWYIDNDGEGTGEIQKYKKYISWCANHNSKCGNVLSIAIACGNQSLAKKILHCFRKDPELLLKNERKEAGRLYYDVYAHYTNASKDAAKIKYDEAVKSGAFN